MSKISERRKQRYAEDPEFRETVLATNRRWAERNSDKISARLRNRWRTDAEFRAKGLARSREAWPKSVYGITLDDRARMLAEQHGVCKICRKKAPAGKTLCIDHCHLFNKVRALLCNNCNSGLGHFHDDPDLLRAAADFLDEWFARMGVRERGPVARPLMLATAVRTRPLADARPIFSMGPPRA